MSMPGSDLSQPASSTEPSRRSAIMTVSTESAMTSRLTSEKCMPSWPMRDAVGDGDGAELQRVAAAGVHALLRRLREAVEREVARGDLVPGARDADLRLVPVGVAHADGAQHSAGGGGFDSVGDDAGAGLDVDGVRQAWYESKDSLGGAARPSPAAALSSRDCAWSMASSSSSASRWSRSKLPVR